MLCEESFKKTCEASFGMYLEKAEEGGREELYETMAREVVREGGGEGEGEGRKRRREGGDEEEVVVNRREGGKDWMRNRDKV